MFCHICYLQDAVNRAIPQDGGGGVDPVAEGGGELPRIVSYLMENIFHDTASRLDLSFLKEAPHR